MAYDHNFIRYKMQMGRTIDNFEVGMLCDEIDRLRGEKQTPQGKTVRVTAMVAMEPNGNWCAYGRSSKSKAGRLADANCALMGMSPFSKVYKLTADLPVPEEIEVKAEICDE